MYEHLIHYCHKIVLRQCPLLHDLLRHCPLLQYPPPFFIYSVIVHSCIFSPPLKVASTTTNRRLVVIATGFTKQTATHLLTLTSTISHRISTNYASAPGRPGGAVAPFAPYQLRHCNSEERVLPRVTRTCQYSTRGVRMLVALLIRRLRSNRCSLQYSVMLYAVVALRKHVNGGCCCN